MKEHQISIEEYEANHYPTDMMTFVRAAPTQTIKEEIIKHYWKFNDGYYKTIMVSISGGADSDRMIDMIEHFGYPPGSVHYCYYNTGMEYRATIEHLDDLRLKYGIEIKEFMAKCPVGKAVKKYGYPFLSKQISDYIHRLQRHGFSWEDGTFDDLYAKYPKCKAALRWWCNDWGEKSQKNIKRRKYLKEFMIAFPPQIPISDACCTKTKKDTAKSMAKEIQPDLNVQGIRKSEGGVRSSAYKGCFDDVHFGCSRLRPLYWFKAEDCRAYDETFNVSHSKCYTLYGLKRTGCACCPFGKYWQRELEAAEKYEPKLANAALVVFGPAYEYTLEYYKFREEMNAAEKIHKGG